MLVDTAVAAVAVALAFVTVKSVVLAEAETVPETAEVGAATFEMMEVVELLYGGELDTTVVAVVVLVTV